MGAAVPPSSPDDPVQIGSVLDGRYRIDAVIGSGGMGRVYRAEHTGIGRSVAIKVLHADLGHNREAVTRFQREALASGRLDHPNIVGVSDFGVLEGVGCFLVMESLEGESLGTRLERGKLPWREALEIMRGILAGLRHAHERGVVHRDIKPDNLFLAVKDGDTVVKILDFGIAKLYAGSGDDPATTRAGLTVGTPAYLSPEQAVGGEITPASDLYSTTIVLFEMITGRVPFDGKDPLAMLTSHVSRTPPALRDVAPDLALPAGLEQLVVRGMVKTQADRIASANEYLAAVHELLGIAPPAQARGSQPVVDVPPLPAPAPSRSALATAPTTSLAATPTQLPLAARAVSLADVVELPRSAVIKAGIAIGVIALIGVIAAIASSMSSSSGPEPTAVVVDAGVVTPSPPPPPRVEAKPGPKQPKAQAGPPAPIQTVPISDPPPPEPPAQVTIARDAELKADLEALWKGKSCADRKAAVDKLAALGDARAVPELKKARHWIHDRYAGLRHEDWNACLPADADAAIKKLTPTP